MLWQCCAVCQSVCYIYFVILQLEMLTLQYKITMTIERNSVEGVEKATENYIKEVVMSDMEVG